MKPWMIPVAIWTAMMAILFSFWCAISYSSYGTLPWNDWRVVAPGVLMFKDQRIEISEDVRSYKVSGPGFSLDCYSVDGCQHKAWRYIQDRRKAGFK